LRLKVPEELLPACKNATLRPNLPAQAVVSVRIIYIRRTHEMEFLSSRHMHAVS